METITLEIPKEIEARVINGYCLQHGQSVVGTITGNKIRLEKNYFAS